MVFECKKLICTTIQLSDFIQSDQLGYRCKCHCHVEQSWAEASSVGGRVDENALQLCLDQMNGTA